MSADRLRELWSKSLLGAELADAEKRELLDGLRDDAALREEFLNDRELDGLLRASDPAERESDAFERSFRVHLEHERDGGPFIERVRSKFHRHARIAGRRRPGDGRIFWITALAAAGLLAVVAAVAGSGRRERPEPPIRPEAKVVEPDPAPPLEDVDPRKRFQDRLQDFERRREELTRPEPGPDPAEEEKRKDALRRLAEERLAIEEEMRRAVERFKAATPAPAPAPRIETTRAAVAVLAVATGPVFVRADGARTAARIGQELLVGHDLETGADGRAVVSYPDQTRLDLAGDTEIRDLRVTEGKRLFVARGDVSAEVSPQPAGRPMILATPQGEAVVLGTTLRVAVVEGATRLEVRSGKVRLTATHLGKGIEVSGGRFAVAAPGTELVSKPLPIDEILLLPGMSKIFGTDWRRVKDAGAAGDGALEARVPLTAADAEVRFKKGALGYAEFSFQADAGKDYAVWIRGRGMLEGDLKDRFGSDMVAIEAPDHQGVGRALPFCLGNNAYGFTGWGYRPGYWWVGGNADATKGVGETDVEPVTLRFPRPGRQLLRMYVYESPMRIDAIWLSATQRKRPADERKGP